VKYRNPLLKEAYSSFRGKRYSDAALLLEKVVSSDERNPYPYLLLAISHLLSDRFNLADEIIKKIRNIDPNYRPLAQLEAFLKLKAAPNIESAVRDYIDILGKFPGDRRIKRALGVLSRTKNFGGFQRDARLGDYVDIPKPPAGVHLRARTPGYPSPPLLPKKMKSKIIIFFVVIILLLPLILFREELHDRVLTKKIGLKREDRGRIEQVTLEGRGFDLIEKINKGKTPEFYYSSEAISADFNRAKRLMKSGKYNEALLLLNRIYNSNANLMVKERVEFLRRFTAGIEDREQGTASWKEISAKPHLYYGVSVNWSGRVANLRKREKGFVFNLLVDYRSNDVFSGISDVYSEREYDRVSNGSAVSVHAVYIANMRDERPYLKAMDIIPLK
jgi:tetratricopeptide (TPR) repeat protein